jgi:Holliday junction resolvase
MNKWAKVTRDASHLSIQKELRKFGYCVVDLAGVGDDVPDLLVASPTTCCLVEIKESVESLLFVSQIAWIARYPHNVMIALTVEDIVDAMRNEFFLRQLDKDKMLQIATAQEIKSKADKPQMSVKRLRKLMNEV